MKLIGMIDSPYVRRVAISLTKLNLAFAHLPLSVFSDFDKVQAINPVVKVPTLVTDNGTALMESCLILDYAERLAGDHNSLLPADLTLYTRAQKITGLALGVCDKAVQAVYEYKLRPDEKQYQPWLDRVHTQLAAGLECLEQEARNATPWMLGTECLQADITSAVAFRFACAKLPGHIHASTYPALASLSAQAEATDSFKAFPFPEDQ